MQKPENQKKLYWELTIVANEVKFWICINKLLIEAKLQFSNSHKPPIYWQKKLSNH